MWNESEQTSNLPWGLFLWQSLCLAAVDGSRRWQRLHKPLWCDHECRSFSAAGVESFAPVPHCACVFIRWMSRLQNSSWMLTLQTAKKWQSSGSEEPVWVVLIAGTLRKTWCAPIQEAQAHHNRRRETHTKKVNKRAFCKFKYQIQTSHNGKPSFKMMVLFLYPIQVAKQQRSN